MSMTANTITSAGLAVGIGLLAAEHIQWWRGSGGAAVAASGGKGKGAAPAAAAGKALDPVAILPLWLGITFGVLMVGCPAGALGASSGFLRWGGSGIGDMIMSGLTGRDAPTVASATTQTLDGNGALVVTFVTIVLWLLRKKFAKAVKGKFKKGVLIGVLLCIGTGVFAYLGQVIIPGANGFGAWALNGITHRTFV